MSGFIPPDMQGLSIPHGNPPPMPLPLVGALSPVHQQAIAANLRHATFASYYNDASRDPFWHNSAAILECFAAAGPLSLKKLIFSWRLR
jgi:hypothetical protein